PLFYTLSLHDALPISFVRMSCPWSTLLLGAVSVSRPGPLTTPERVVEPTGVGFVPVFIVAWTWISVSVWSTTGLVIVTTSPVSRSEEHTSELQSRSDL